MVLIGFDHFWNHHWNGIGIDKMHNTLKTNRLESMYLCNFSWCFLRFAFEWHGKNKRRKKIRNQRERAKQKPTDSIKSLIHNSICSLVPMWKATHWDVKLMIQRIRPKLLCVDFYTFRVLSTNFFCIYCYRPSFHDDRFGFYNKIFLQFLSFNVDVFHSMIDSIRK